MRDATCVTKHASPFELKGPQRRSVQPCLRSCNHRWLLRRGSAKCALLPPLPPLAASPPTRPPPTLASQTGTCGRNEPKPAWRHLNRERPLPGMGSEAHGVLNAVRPALTPHTVPIVARRMKSSACTGLARVLSLVAAQERYRRRCDLGLHRQLVKDGLQTGARLGWNVRWCGRNACTTN